MPVTIRSQRNTARPANKKAAVDRYTKALAVVHSVETATRGRWPGIVASFARDAEIIRGELIAYYPNLAKELGKFEPTDYSKRS